MFWDASALIPLLVEEPRSEAIRALPGSTPALWWATSVECTSAICRLERENHLSETEADAVLADLRDRLEEAVIVLPSEILRQRAERLLRVHALRAADALQLAAALAYCEERPRGVGFVCLDDRLRAAARAEGFRVFPSSSVVG